IEREPQGVDYPLLLCGHSHIPRALRLAAGRLVGNPGSGGLPPSLGSADGRYSLVEERRGSWGGDLRVLPYDIGAAAAQARAAGFEIWATAVVSGWSTPSDL